MIRHARLSDLQQVRYLAQAQFAPNALQIRGPRPAFDYDLREMVTREEILIYIEENAIRGFVCYHFDGPDAHVLAVAVAPKWKRRGVGRILLDRVDTQALDRHARRAVFHPLAQSFENLTYFHGKGYQEVDRRTEDGFEVVYMERYLR